jgi:hypothetical protein
MNMWRRGTEVHSRGRPARFSALCATLLSWGMALAVVAPAAAVLDLKRGDTPPPITALSIDGQDVDLADLRGRIVVVLFAEAGHERSQQAARDIAKALFQDGVNGKPVSWIVLYTKGSDPQAIASEAFDLQAGTPGTVVVHDLQRQVFGDYHAIAMPSTVIIDGEGKVVHAMAGLNQRFRQTVSDALLVAAGKMTPEDFEVAIRGPAEERDEDQRRAERLAQLARRLAERSQFDLAEMHYLDALSLAPDLVPARLGLADLMIHKRRLDEAEFGFRSVLLTQPKSLEAATGLAFVHVLRGETSQAEAIVSDVLQRSPSRARAHYVMGLVQEQRGEHAQAAASFRRATELLLNRAGMDEPANGDQP